MRVNWASQRDTRPDTSNHFHIFVGDLAAEVTPNEPRTLLPATPHLMPHSALTPTSIPRTLYDRQAPAAGASARMCSARKPRTATPCRWMTPCCWPRCSRWAAALTHALFGTSPPAGASVFQENVYCMAATCCDLDHVMLVSCVAPACESMTSLAALEGAHFRVLDIQQRTSPHGVCDDAACTATTRWPYSWLFCNQL